jgi:hypothetical protein
MPLCGCGRCAVAVAVEIVRKKSCKLVPDLGPVCLSTKNGHAATNRRTRVCLAMAHRRFSLSIFSFSRCPVTWRSMFWPTAERIKMYASRPVVGAARESAARGRCMRAASLCGDNRRPRNQRRKCTRDGAFFFQHEKCRSVTLCWRPFSALFVHAPKIALCSPSPGSNAVCNIFFLSIDGPSLL